MPLLQATHSVALPLGLKFPAEQFWQASEVVFRKAPATQLGGGDGGDGGDGGGGEGVCGMALQRAAAVASSTHTNAGPRLCDHDPTRISAPDPCLQNAAQRAQKEVQS